jgi:hypothetical protein
MIDLRTDTVTHPTEEMRDAMRRAELGDDGRDGDPTVRRLEDMAAAAMPSSGNTAPPASLCVVSRQMSDVVKCSFVIFVWMRSRSAATSGAPRSAG